MQIKQIIKKFIPQVILDKRTHIQKQLANFRTLSKEYGQYQTIVKWSCIDKDNNPIPWYTYPAIEFLKNLDFGSKIVLEYGSGNSSSFWAKRAKKVISIERDKKWFEMVSANKLPNQEIYLKELDANYTKSPNTAKTLMGGGISYKDSTNTPNNLSHYPQSQNPISQNLPSYVTFPLTLNMKFDVIIIDGSYRFECASIVHHLLNLNADDGYMVILDNADWFKNSSKLLREELDLIEVDFHGFAPINAYTHTTSIFFSRNFAFSPNGEQPHYSISAIHHYED